MEVVTEVTGYQGKYTAQVMKEGLFESVMWPFLGKIIAPFKKVQAKNQNKGCVPYNKIEKP